MKALVLFSFTLLLLPRESLAYFDPGSGSLFIQALVAIVGGSVLFFKEIRLKIMSLLPGRKLKKDEGDRENEKSS